MAGNLWGADVAQLRTLAQQFGKTSDSLLQQSTQLSNQINNNPAWKGQDAVTFRAEWNSSHRALIQRTALALKQESKKLLTQAEQQEKASDAAPGSGGGPGTISDPGGTLAGLAGGVLLGGIGALKAGLTVQKFIKAPFTLAKHIGQYSWVLKNQRADFIKSMTKGQHRLGGPVFDSRNLLQTTKGNAALEDLLRNSSKANRAVSIAEKASDIASLKNLNKYIGPLGKFEGFFAEKPLIGKGTGYEWLGKGGLGRSLGWAGVAFSAADSVTAFANGDVKGGLVGVGKTALGIGCFLPPPAGTVCQVASVGIAIYENWDTISSVGKNVGEGIANAVKDPGKFINSAADTVNDGLKSVGNFLGIGG